MKNKDIHKGFPGDAIRDFLSKSLGDNVQREAGIAKGIAPFDRNNAMESLVLDAQHNVDYWRAKHEVYLDRLAIVKMIAMNGWGEHDVSDDTLRETDQKYWLSFIGTNSELEELMQRIRKEK